MRSIGIRAAPTGVVFAIYDDEQHEVLNVELIKIPKAFLVPDALKYVRSNLLDVIREYDVECAGIRITESSAQTPDHARIQIEGVIQEAFASSPLKSYYVGQISTIAAKLGIDRVDFKKYIEGTISWDVENWSSMNGVQREAILCAIGAINV
jgi:hypothetical protein